MTELALSIVFDNTNCFKNLNKEQTKMLIFTCKDAQLNSNVQQMRIKYSVMHLCEEVKDLVTSLVFARQNEDVQKIDNILVKINTIIYNIYVRDDELSDAFIRLMMAEYKEMIFDSIYDPSLLDIDLYILDEYDQIIIDNEELFDPYNHYHDPTHYMFADTEYVYSFYELCEKDGHSILARWHTVAGMVAGDDDYSDDDYDF